MRPVIERLGKLYQANPTAEGGEQHDHAWYIGETLAACGGYELMWSVFQAIERCHGPSGAAWLDRAWSGIDVDGIVLWVTDKSSWD